MKPSSLLEADKPETLIDKITREVYASDNGKRGKRAMMASLEGPRKVAVALDQLIAQVNNGGFRQWIDNGYAELGGDDVMEFANDNAHVSELQELGDLLGRLLEAADVSDFSDGDDFERDSAEEIQEKFVEYVQGGMWSELDELLGGTDLDERKYQEVLENELSEATVYTKEVSAGSRERLAVELKSDLGDASLPDPPAERWVWCLKTQPSDRGAFPGRGAFPVYTSRKFYPSEEAAEQAAETEAANVTLDMLNDDERGELEDSALEVLVNEYADSFKDQSLDFDQFDDDFYSIDIPALKQAASQIIQAELEGDEEPEEPAKPDLKDLPPPDYRPRQGDQDFRQEALAR